MELWEIDAFRRWWDLDWSWDGLSDKYRRPTLVDPAAKTLGNLQHTWSSESERLFDFGGRQWTRFHLPPFDRRGNPCPTEIWKRAKGQSFLDEVNLRLAAPNLRNWRKKGNEVFPTDFADLRGVVFPRLFEMPNNPEMIDISDFSSCVFLGKLERRNCALALRLEDTIFCDLVTFSDVTFVTRLLGDRAHCQDMICAVNSKFSQDCDFVDATFAESVLFMGILFEKDCRFGGTTYGSHMRFWKVDFRGKALFAGTTAFPRDVSFGKARFFREAVFSNRIFTEHTDFAEVQFNQIPDFVGAQLHPDTTFRNAIFPDGRHRPFVSPKLSWFRSEGDMMPKNSATDFRQNRKKIFLYRWRNLLPGILRWPLMSTVREAHDLGLERCETAYRELRRLCERAGNVEYEGLFHSLEIRAHRFRTDAAPTARVMGLFYEWMSDHGRSMGRPLVWLFCAWITAAVSYAELFSPPYHSGGVGIAIEECEKIIARPSMDDYLVSAAHQFLPSLYGIVTNANRPEWLRCGEADHPLLYLGVATIQVLIFFVTVALFLIALRRRFQIRT
jgi:hypothetical protein